MSSSHHPVLLYDGECGLCNALVRFMLRHDRRGVLLFAPLQGVTAQAFLKAKGEPTEDFDSLVFIEDLSRPDTAFFRRTPGALRALAEMGGGWRRMASVLSFVPAFLSDAGYQIIARMRYRLFGRYRPSPLPNPAWAKRILE